MIAVVAIVGLSLALLFEDLLVALYSRFVNYSLAGVLISLRAGCWFAVGLIVAALGFVGLARAQILSLDHDGPERWTKQWVDLSFFC